MGLICRRKGILSLRSDEVESIVNRKPAGTMNEYHIYEELGKGKKSVVYKGRKHKSIEYVAVKSVDRDQMDKVLHEVQVMYRLKHRTY